MNFPRIFRTGAIGITCAIWVLSLVPISQNPVPGGDKLHHLLAYAGLMLVWRLALVNPCFLKQCALATSLISMGIAIEFAQALTPYRFFEWADAAANTAGVFIGWIVSALMLRVAPADWFAPTK